MVSYATRDAGLHDRLGAQQIRQFAERRWRLIASTTFLLAAAALIVCLWMSPNYVATAQVLLDPPRKQALEKDVSSSDTLDSSVVDSQVYLVLSSETLARVVASEKLDQDPEFSAPAKPSLLRRLFGFMLKPTATEEMPRTDGEIDTSKIPVIMRLYHATEVARVGRSNVISITVTAHSPRKATRLANAIARTYVDYQVEVRAKASRQVAAQFEDRLQALREQVRNSEMAVSNFRKQYGLTTTADEKVTVSDQELTSLNEKLTSAVSDTADKRAKYEQAKPFIDGAGDASALGDVIRSPVISQLRGQQAELMRRSADLSQIYGPSHPALRQLSAQRAAINAALKAEETRLVSTLRNDYNVALARENALRAMIVKLSDPSQTNGDVGVKLRELERTNSANKALFESFLNQAKLTQERPGFEMPDARIISPALEPLQAASPKTNLIVAVAALAGFVLGLGIAAGLDNIGGVPAPEREDDSIAKAVNEAPIIGHFAAMEPFESRALEPTFFDGDRMESARPSAFTSSLATLSARIDRGLTKAGGPLFVCAPVKSPAGCSTLLYWLAQYISASGKRVLLIDADNSNPDGGLSAKMKLRTNAGLAEVLRGAAKLDSAAVSREKFRFLPLGRGPLDTKALASVLSAAKRAFDVILVDCPPLASDAHDATWRKASNVYTAVVTSDMLNGGSLEVALKPGSGNVTFDGLIVIGVTPQPRETYLHRAS
jgi:uncharacterized protein involved in exopolysaccharide biosynthesis